ncbi:bifunctional UDP-N-acetylmuramoyl-tripeptide:D-alanyl-D-alanine ligase/alanine racemase [Halosquirtibacter laminarini]|uniref:Bifunctional UDP-N-acetylmuramoyl-tripeptide:D-alanyl-D-alanine ligase/alanine racemase n=1 Tax=Halosquirtibacter laminarini TaxID=3374600 RepID=A0AC61NMN9_9BACT|nr:bifunctional UDP-N-acetylmuramoyl-tripeptide:D-alanyl-D-alanine ligase/alanine racemase [Prolixibacteraceae bacterium]
MNYPLRHLVSLLDCTLNRSDIDDILITNMAIDTRSLGDTVNTLFVCLKGTKSDGHNFIKSAVALGVRVFLVKEFPREVYTEAILFIKVEDVLRSMQKIASDHRYHFSIPVVGITGSNGKTQVKEWIYQVLFRTCNIVKSPRSFNSQIGVPLSVQFLDASHELALFEAGISLPHEMGFLEKIISPTLGILTHMGDAHLSNFESRKVLLNEKLNLFQHVEKLLFCDSQAWVKDLVSKQISERSRLFVISYEDDLADVFIKSVIGVEECTTIELIYKQKGYLFSIPFTDEASVENAILSASFILYMDLWDKKISERFKLLERISLRLELKDGLHASTIIDDSYNSDLLSLRVALNYQDQNNKEGQNKVLVLSDLSQQRDDDEADIYHEISMLLAHHDIMQLYAVGPRLYHYRNLFKTINSKFYLETDQLIKDIPNLHIAGNSVLIKGTRSFKLEEFSYQIQEKTHQTYLEINLDAMRENLLYYRSLLEDDTKVMAMVKASSYGSGSIEVAHLLQRSGIDYLAVAIADEGIELRKANITTPIIVMNPEKHAFELMLEYNLEPNIYDLSLLREFAVAVAKSEKSKVDIHLKFDTGMRRLGFDKISDIELLGTLIPSFACLKVKSVFTHLSVSDTIGEEHFTKQQLDQFELFASILGDKLGYSFYRHALNTAGIERFVDHQYDMVRLGLGLYGVSFFKQSSLTEVMTLKTQVSQIKSVDPEDTIGYGRHGRRNSSGKIAVLPIGYADGFHRKLGNGNHSVLIKGGYAPTIGNICMDMCMVDITNVPDVSIGDEVVVFGPNHSIHHISDSLETIPYEVMTGIGPRVKKIYFSEM